ncbi:MAG: hypothetical protein AAB333_04360, partial [Pseudomonadota bacterium]
YNTSWESSGSCEGTPAAAPATCSFTPKEAGGYRITATVKGNNGKANIGSSDFWVTGSDVVLWDSEPDTALRLFPEKPSYKVGETARYLIQNPDLLTCPSNCLILLVSYRCQIALGNVAKFE